MLSDELLKKVRRIELTTRKMVDDAMSGQYRSHFKGHGVQFSEHRVYTPGDDVRHIDWKVSARSREPLLKKYEEERELNVFLVVDVSGSEGFGSSRKLKSEVVAEVGGMLAYAATLTGDKVGALLFAGEVEKTIRPKKGRQHVLRIVHDLLTHKPKSQGTQLSDALESADRLMKHAGIVFVISDFLTDGYELSLKKLAIRHDVIVIQVGDDRETQVPPAGIYLFRDPESGQEAMVDTASFQFKKWLKEQDTVRQKRLLDTIRSSRAELLRLKTGEDYPEAVVKFFRTRTRRR